MLVLQHILARTNVERTLYMSPIQGERIVGAYTINLNIVMTSSTERVDGYRSWALQALMLVLLLLWCGVVTCIWDTHMQN